MNRRARTLRQRPTDAERALWRQLRFRQIDGYKFRRQHPIGPYVGDFVCLERKVIVEVDGGQHAVQIQQDAERTAWLASVGYHVIRFWDHEALTELESVKEAIRRSLTPHLNPPPQGGRSPQRERKNPQSMSLPRTQGVPGGKVRMGGGEPKHSPYFFILP